MFGMLSVLAEFQCELVVAIIYTTAGRILLFSWGIRIFGDIALVSYMGDERWMPA